MTGHFYFLSSPLWWSTK